MKNLSYRYTDVIFSMETLHFSSNGSKETSMVIANFVVVVVVIRK